MLTGLLGLLAAILTGTGEFLLHYDPLARFSEKSYDFMLAASDERQTIGHFIGVLGAPLYVVGCWHIYLMLKPAGQKIAFIGESGSGKSTLLALLRGLYPPVSLQLSLDGKAVNQLSLISDHVTLFPQEPEIFENTIKYNISLGIEHTHEI